MEIYDLEKIMSEFDDFQLKLIFQNLNGIELTDGCTVGCDFCGLGSKKNIDSKIRYDQFEYLFKRFKDELTISNPILNYATDPLDWEDNGKTIIDLYKLVWSQTKNTPFVSTAIPKGKENLAYEMLNQRLIDRVSITHMNFFRLQDFFNEKLPGLKNPLYRRSNEILPKNLRKTLKNSWGKKNLLENKYPPWINYILLMQNKNENYVSSYDGKRYSGYEKYKLGEKNIDNLSKIGINDFHGVILRHDGFYNVTDLIPSKDYPYGIKLEKISSMPNEFKVNDYWRLPRNSPNVKIIKKQWFIKITDYKNFPSGYSQSNQPVNSTILWSDQSYDAIKIPSQKILKRISVIERWDNEQHNFSDTTLNLYKETLNEKINEYNNKVRKYEENSALINPYHQRIKESITKINASKATNQATVIDLIE